MLKLNKEILRLAIPNIISNVSIPLLSSVDTMLMGHLSALELGAVGVSATIFNVLYWNFGFLRMGTTGMTAQAFGKGNEKAISNMLRKAMLFAILISVVLLFLMVPIGRIAALLMNVEALQQEFVYQYFYTRIWAAPASLSLYALLGWYFGMQNAKIPLLLTVAINSVNIICSYYLVKIMDYGIAGVAWGTVIGQYFGLILGLILLWSYYRKYIQFKGLKEILSWEELAVFFNVNKDIFIRTVFLSFSFAFLYAQSALQGEIVLAANVVLMQFLNWMSYGIDGFAYAAESLVGKYFGAEKFNETKKVIRLIFIWGFCLAALYALVYYYGGDLLIKLFTNQPEVIAKSGQLLIWVVLIPLFAFACYLWDGIYIGLTASKAMRNTMIISFAIYMGVYYGFQNQFSQNLIWIAMFAFLAARGLFQTILYLNKGFELQ